MGWLIAVGALVAAVLVAVALRGGMKRKARERLDEVRRKFGVPVLECGCGIVAPPNRVPGVLALTDSHLCWRSLVPVPGGDGDAPLKEIADITWEDARHSSTRMARKYAGARILTVTLSDGARAVFAIGRKHAPEWEAALQIGTTA